MNSIEAKAYVDNLYRELHLHWKRRISQGPFMSQLREGRLPLPCARRFFKDWGLFSVEVVALNAVSYYVHLPFFINNYDLMPAFTEKIAEELISPKPPGHTLILLETAEALGLSRQEVLEQPASAAGRAPRRSRSARDLTEPARSIPPAGCQLIVTPANAGSLARTGAIKSRSSEYRCFFASA